MHHRGKLVRVQCLLRELQHIKLVLQGIRLQMLLQRQCILFLTNML